MNKENKETVGAWVIHHGQKVRADALGASDFPALDTSAKAATLFSQLAGKSAAVIDKNAVQAFAASIGLNPKLELSSLLTILADHHLVEIGSAGVEVIGATTRGALIAAADILADLDPTQEELAAIDLAELTSEAPKSILEVSEYVGDQFRLSKNQTADFLSRAEHIGFVDAEGEKVEKLFFNGNLFRVAGPAKVQKVLSTLTESDTSRLMGFSERLSRQGYVPLTSAARELGEELMSKLRAIGFFDISYVHNEFGSTGFVTKPDAFHKFVSPLVDDAFDLGKALVAALGYGINKSDRYRGQIWGVDLLLRKLIGGGTVGPAQAIGQDYKYLEQRGVVEVIPSGWSFSMRLLKPEIGEIALEVLTKGDSSHAQVLEAMPASPMTGFQGPEASRSRFRKSERGRLRRADQDILHALRTKGVR